MKEKREIVNSISNTIYELKEEIRKYLSEFCFAHSATFDNPVIIDIDFEENQGLSSLQSGCYNSVYEDKEGIIWFVISIAGDVFLKELDELSFAEQVYIIENMPE